MSKYIEVKIIWWGDIHHHEHVSLIICDLVYTIETNLENKHFELTKEMIDEIIQAIMFFEVQDEAELLSIHEFNPHIVFGEESYTTRITIH